MLILLALACGGITPVPSKTDSLPGFRDSGETGEQQIDSENHDGNTAPVADAGADQTGTLSVPVLLDGSGSLDPDGDKLTYSWEITQQPSGSSVSLISADHAKPQFIPDRAGVFVVELIVSDGALDSKPDEVRITAMDPNGPPVADAGPNQTVTAGMRVDLDGSGSSDPNGDSLRYSWTMTAAPSGSAAALSNAAIVAPKFTADKAGQYSFTLTVSDGVASSSPDTVLITAEGDGGGGGGGGGGTTTTACGCTQAPEGLVPSALVLAFGLLGSWRWRRRA